MLGVTNGIALQNAYLVRFAGRKSLGPAIPPATSSASPLTPAQRADLNHMLEGIENKALDYFLKHTLPNGLVPDRIALKTQKPSSDMASIAATGFGLSAWVLACEKKKISKAEAKKQVLKALDFAEKQGHRGWLPHFFSIKTGELYKKSEYSTIDTALFILGALSAGEYFGGEAKQKAEALFNRIDFSMIYNSNAKNAFHLGFHLPDNKKENKPVFLPYVWDEFSEGVLVPFLALGATKKPVSDNAWAGWKREKNWEYNGQKTFVNLPLFTYLYPLAFLDLKNKKDRYGDDLWQAAQTAVSIQRVFCKDNGYPDGLFGLTACDGPEDYRVYWASKTDKHTFHDGTIAPPIIAASLPFAEKAVYDNLKTLEKKGLLQNPFGIACAYNVRTGWQAKDALGIDLGSMLLLLDAHQKGTIHRLLNQSPVIKHAMHRAFS